SAPEITTRSLRPGPRPGAARPPVPDDEIPDRARREFAPFDSNAALGLPHHVSRKSHGPPAPEVALLQDDLHRPARRTPAFRPHERPARAYILQRARNARRSAACQLHGLMHGDTLTPSMLHDRLSPTLVVSEPLCAHR